MDEDFLGGGGAEPPGTRTFPEVPGLRHWWQYAAWGVGIYGALVLLGYAFPAGGRREQVGLSLSHSRISH